MTAHKHSGRWKLGFLLTMGTLFFWGAQSIAMAILVKNLPSTMVAFSKLFISAIFLTFVLTLRKQFPIPLERKVPIWLLLLAGTCLALSYSLFAMAFLHISPANVQLYMQSERILLSLCGVFLFKEAFRKSQWIGLGILPIGYYIFYKDQLGVSSSYSLGVALVIATAVTWVAYALCQKQLLRFLSSQQSLFFIFLISSFILCPFLEFKSFGAISFGDGIILGFVCLSSLSAFVCFSEALNHWDISRVGALISLTPLVTIFLTYLLSRAFPLFVVPEKLSNTGSEGAFLVVFGSMLVSLSGHNGPKR